MTFWKDHVVLWSPDQTSPKATFGEKRDWPSKKLKIGIKCNFRKFKLSKIRDAKRKITNILFGNVSTEIFRMKCWWRKHSCFGERWTWILRVAIANWRFWGFLANQSSDARIKAQIQKAKLLTRKSSNRFGPWNKDTTDSFRKKWLQNFVKFSLIALSGTIRIIRSRHKARNSKFSRNDRKKNLWIKLLISNFE